LLLWDGLWENDTSYHYLRLMHSASDQGQILIVGGEDHKTGQQDEHIDPYQNLERWTRERFPMAGEVAHKWSGEVLEPADCLAYIGRSATGGENVYVVTGDSGNGITHAAIAALLIPDLISGRPNRWADLYDPARKVGLHALRDYAAENLNTFAQYADWVRRGDVASEQQIAPGEGGVIVQGMKRIAVYKDPSHHCTRLSAVCPHLGGVVRWNAIEKTWDCPCHASRFDKAGRVIHGPANRDLPAIGRE
jgi:nitrite reductase/ring-hydroxylating ferredoxin subunit